MTAPTVADPHVPAGDSVTPAISGATGAPAPASDGTTTPSSATTPETPRSTSDGVTPTRSASGSESPSSKTSDAPSSGSTRRWRSPANARQFAAQANRVATMVLNGEMDGDTARLYSAVARTVAQALSTEVSRARFLAKEPDLTLEDGDVWEDA